MPLTVIPRQRRSAERRRLLAKTTVKLSDQRGFEALSVNEIAEAAGISIGGLYRHIRQKSDLLVLACDGIFSGLLVEMRAAAAREQGLSEKLAAAIRIYWLACRERADLIRLTYREYTSLPPEAKEAYKRQEREIAEFLRDIIRAGVLTDEFQPVDDRVVAHEIIFLSHMMAFKHWALHESSPEALLDEHLALFDRRLRKM